MHFNTCLLCTDTRSLHCCLHMAYKENQYVRYSVISHKCVVRYSCHINEKVNW